MNDISGLDENRYFSWLARLLDPDRFDVVVPVERKATAIIRALLDLTPEQPCTWDWSRVLSSDALPFLPSDWLANKRVLVFNEMVHRGTSTQKAVDAIVENTPTAAANIERAAFIVHEDYGREDHKPYIHALRRGICDRLYGVIRERLVTSLREKGALLLDTEHVETTFELTMPERRFLEYLGTFGIPIEYRDTRRHGFPGVTVRSPVVEDLESLRPILPDGADIDSAEPKKIRLVRRSATEFAFIPIWYPPIPEESVQRRGGWLAPPKYVRSALEQCPVDKLPDLAFHLAGLVASVELVRSVWLGIGWLVGRGVEPQTPEGSIRTGSPLGHLRALYPLLDFEELAHALASAVSAHKKTTQNAAASHRLHQRAGWTTGSRLGSIERVCSVDARETEDVCVTLLAELLRIRSQYSISEDWFSVPAEAPRLLFSWTEFWQLGEQLGVPESIRSVAMDIAIDNAFLKTSHLIVCRGGRRMLVRGFEPDSEYAFETLERLAYGAEELAVLPD